MTCPNSTWNELWYQGLSKDFLISSYIKSSEGKTIFYPWANSGLIVWVICWNHLRDGTHTLFYAKKPKPPPLPLTICLSLSSLVFHMTEFAISGIIRVLFQTEENQIKPSVPGYGLCDYVDKEAWRAVVHGTAKSQTRLSNWTELNCYFWSLFPVSPLSPSSSLPRANAPCPEAWTAGQSS